MAKDDKAAGGDPMDSRRRIVAAMDGSPASRLALRRAADEAIAHAATLEVVLAWGLLDQPLGEDFKPGFSEADARRILDEMVTAELGSLRPAGTVLHVVNDLPARAVLEVAEGAWLVVLGSRGLGGFKGLLLGSVSQQVVHHAPCPVLIVPGPAAA